MKFLQTLVKKEAHKFFLDCIWDATIANVTISEYLDDNPEVNQLWINMETKCNKYNVSIWEVTQVG